MNHDGQAKAEVSSGRQRVRARLAPSVLLSVMAMSGVLALELFSVQSDQPAAVLFPTGVSEAQAFRMVIAAGGRPVRAAHSVLAGDVVWLSAADDPGFFARVVRSGALMVINPFAFGGCLMQPI